jgi:D-glycero-alpha-D-manno-heptose-7-phosphate kinase
MAIAACEGAFAGGADWANPPALAASARITSLIRSSIVGRRATLNITSGIVELSMKINSEAPCRVDLAGGTLDIWPLYLFHPDAVTLNFAINRWTRCVIEPQDSPEIRLRSGDLEAEETFASFDELRNAERPRLPLVTYVLRFFEPRVGLTVHTDSEAPAGAGISGSSALIIAVASALNRLTRAHYSLEKLREIAQNIEAQIIRVPTGAQDYYPAMYGGVSAIELGPAGIRRLPIPVDLDDFNERIVLAYTGVPRNSGINNWEVTKAYIDGSREVRRNFEQITAIACGMRVALEKANWVEAGRLLREEWSHRRKNAPGISTPMIDLLVKTSRRAGALGAKVCGAGGGGCVFFLVERGAKDKVTRAIEKAGAEVLPVKVATHGVKVRVTRGS